MQIGLVVVLQTRLDRHMTWVGSSCLQPKLVSIIVAGLWWVHNPPAVTAVAADAWQGLDLTAALHCRLYQALQSNLQPARLVCSLVITFCFSVSQVLMLEKILVFSVDSDQGQYHTYSY